MRKEHRNYKLDVEITDAIDAIMEAENCEFANESELVRSLLRKALGIKPARPSIPKLETIANRQAVQAAKIV